MAVIRRLPGRARPREEVLREYQESNAKVRKNIPAVLWDFLAPDPDQFYRWRVQLDCGCIKELLTLDKEKLPTESRYRCDHLYHSQLQPGQVGCANDEHTRPQPYREIVAWGERREQTFPADPVESRYDDIDQELWAKIRHDAPHTSAFWIVTLSCGHRSEVCTDVDWKPEDGPRYARSEWVQKMSEDSEEYWASHPGGEHEREREHDRRMLAQGWPRPRPETLCFVCSWVRQIVACERVGWLVPRPKPRPSSPKQPSKASLQRRLREVEQQATQLREQLAQLHQKHDQGEGGA